MKPIEEKAVKLVMERRVTIRWHNDVAADGLVDGDTDTYRCSFSPAGRVCTCEAGSHYRDCSHALALELEVMRISEGVMV